MSSSGTTILPFSDVTIAVSNISSLLLTIFLAKKAEKVAESVCTTWADEYVAIIKKAPEIVALNFIYLILRLIV